MAVYLRLPPGSEGTSVPAGQPIEPTDAGQRQWSHWGGRRVHSCGLAASGLGYLNLPMAHSPGLGDSGKCSPPAALASAGPRARGPDVGSGATPVFTRFPLSSADPCEPGLPVPLAWALGPGPVDGTAKPGQRLVWAPDGVKDVTDSIILGPLGPGPAPPLCDNISLTWQAGVLLLFFHQS